MKSRPNTKNKSLDLSGVSIVICCYNSSHVIEPTINAFLNQKIKNDVPYEIIVVDNNCKDNTIIKVRKILLESKNEVDFTIVQESQQGLACARKKGVMRAKYDVIVTIDDDLQNPPEEIPKLLAKISEGYDVVYGRPESRSHSAWRNLSSKILKTVLKVVLGAEMGGKSSAFRAFRG